MPTTVDDYISNYAGDIKVHFEVLPQEVSPLQYKNNIYKYETVKSWSGSTRIPSKTIVKNPGASDKGAVKTIAGEPLCKASMLDILALYTAGETIKFYDSQDEGGTIYTGEFDDVPKFTRIPGTNDYKYSINIALI